MVGVCASTQEYDPTTCTSLMLTTSVVLFGCDREALQWISEVFLDISRVVVLVLV